jgi:hypothetical protein
MADLNICFVCFTLSTSKGCSMKDLKFYGWFEGVYSPIDFRLFSYKFQGFVLCQSSNPAVSVWLIISVLERHGGRLVWLAWELLRCVSVCVYLRVVGLALNHCVPLMIFPAVGFCNALNILGLCCVIVWLYVCCLIRLNDSSFRRCAWARGGGVLARLYLWGSRFYCLSHCDSADSAQWLDQFVRLCVTDCLSGLYNGR